MPDVATLLESVPSSFEGVPTWFADHRSHAASLLSNMGLPTKKTEAWRFTPTRTLAGRAFHRAGSKIKLLCDVPDGVTVKEIKDTLCNSPDTLAGKLAQNADVPFFAALNTVLFEDGIWINVAPGAIVTEPIRVLYDTSRSEEGSAVRYPRVLWTLGERSEATLIETYLGSNAKQLTNGVIEVQLSDGSCAKHVRIHEDQGMCIGRVDVTQHGGSTYHSTVFTLGGKLMRFDVRARLLGEAAQCILNGAYLVDDHDHVDHHLVVEHQSPRCFSKQTYRGVADGHSTVVFDGTVVVHRGASKTEAHQENRNLLLSDTATVHTKPHLEIDTDDVVCSHGVTVGPLDAQQLFYLRTRGIPQEMANVLLTHAFLQDIMAGVDDELTNAQLKKTLLMRLPYDEVVQGFT